MSVLELAQTLGNISQACKRRGVSRTQFYEWKRRFQTHGMEGLRDLPPIVKNHPFTIPKEVVEKIKDLALQHPSKGCKYLSHLLAAECTYVSSVTVQKHLDHAGLGKRYDRWLAVEQLGAQSPSNLTGEQVAFLRSKTPSLENVM